MSNIPEISLAPNTIGQIGPITVTSAMLSYFVVCFALLVIGAIIRANLSLKPGRFQMAFEVIFKMILEKMTAIFGSEKRARRLFPLIFTVFIFLILANYFMLLPWEIFTLSDGTKAFSTPTAHYSLTISFGLMMVVTSHVLAIAMSPLRYIGNFIKIKPILLSIKNLSPKEFGMSVIEFFLGILDIIGEMAKLISVSTRLFGNMFAGGVIITIISGISAYTQFVAPLPFAVLGLLSGIVQAFVFSTLGMIFIGGMMNNVSPAQET